MAQNKSSAVMQQRAHSAPDELDYFPTPPWATRALCQFIGGQTCTIPNWPRTVDTADQLARLEVWEPACGEGHMARPLAEYFGAVRSSDVHPYSPGQLLCDFVLDGPTRSPVDWVVTNPPFNLALPFVETALDRARRGVAMLVRSSWTEGAERFRQLFGPNPPSYVLSFAQRVVMLKGRLVQDGAPDPYNLDPATGRPRKASSATSYSWVIWARTPGETGLRVTWNNDTRHRWVPPCRAALERPGDYPDLSALIAETEARASAQHQGQSPTLEL